MDKLGKGLTDVGNDGTERTERVSILSEAETLVHGKRNDMYGMPWEDYERTVGMFKALMGEDKKISDMTATDGMAFMVCVKLSRQMNRPHRDNLVDATGYLECWQWSIDEEDSV